MIRSSRTLRNLVFARVTPKMPPSEAASAAADRDIDSAHSLVARALHRAVALREKLEGDGAAHAGDGNFPTNLAKMLQDSQAKLDRMSERARVLEERLDEAMKHEDLMGAALEDLSGRLERLEGTLFEAGGYSWDEMAELMANLQFLTAEASAVARSVECHVDGQSDSGCWSVRGRGSGKVKALDVDAAISSAKEAETENIILRKLLQDAGAQLRALTFPDGMPDGAGSKIANPEAQATPRDVAELIGQDQGHAPGISIRNSSPHRYPGYPSPAQEIIMVAEGGGTRGSFSINAEILSALHFAPPPRMAAPKHAIKAVAGSFAPGDGGTRLSRESEPKSQFGSSLPLFGHQGDMDAAAGRHEEPGELGSRWRTTKAVTLWRERLSELREAVDGAVAKMKQWEETEGEIARLQASLSTIS